jgi:hypothetical protein
MREAMVLLARGTHTGAAMFGLAVIVLGGARLGLALAFMALGILTVTLADTWGLWAGLPLVALTVVFTAGGPVTLGFLIVVATGVVALASRLRERHRARAAAQAQWRVA